MVVGRQPDLDALAAALNQAVRDAEQVTLLAIPGDPASTLARTMWTGQGWTVETLEDFPTKPIVASLRLDEWAPDVVLVCQPTGTHEPLAAAIRAGAHRLGVTVVELPRG